MGVIAVHTVSPGRCFVTGEFEVFPFKTDHGAFAKGSVGFMIKCVGEKERDVRVVYTSDFVDIPEFPHELVEPDYLVVQSYWFNEPKENRPNHMSFQRALPLLERIKPRKGTFLVHMGDADTVAGDPCNDVTKKSEPLKPMRPPSGGQAYSVPLSQETWQRTVDRILKDRRIPGKVTVAYDGLVVKI
jgi:phosphoribosyl 1,2-cyclic phosphate phosphodiesterase